MIQIYASCLYQGFFCRFYNGKFPADQKEETLPYVLRVTARADDQEAMAVEHKKYPVYGLQFHPESVLTPEGEKIIQNLVEGYRHD